MILISAAGGRLGFYYKDFEILPPLPGKLTSLLAFDLKRLIFICECVSCYLVSSEQLCW